MDVERDSFNSPINVLAAQAANQKFLEKLFDVLSGRDYNFIVNGKALGNCGPSEILALLQHDIEDSIDIFDAAGDLIGNIDLCYETSAGADCVLYNDPALDWAIAAVPRPAIRAREARIIRNRLSFFDKRHQELLAKGLSPEVAAAQAFKDSRNLRFNRAGEIKKT